jgi:hypothetical protein
MARSDIKDIFPHVILLDRPIAQTGYSYALKTCHHIDFSARFENPLKKTTQRHPQRRPQRDTFRNEPASTDRAVE